jgi:hypothetical protein
MLYYLNEIPPVFVKTKPITGIAFKLGIFIYKKAFNLRGSFYKVKLCLYNITSHSGNIRTLFLGGIKYYEKKYN